uniref:Uncharacterized protein n=1 Tax=Coccolithus braarudii TaxID=221442 RepID=A0A7S0LLM5_9EUKA
MREGAGLPLLASEAGGHAVSEIRPLGGALSRVLGPLFETVQLLFSSSSTPSRPEEASPELHPSGVSRRWSSLYVRLQYAQWYKVLAWIVTVVLGDAETLLSPSTRACLQFEELLIASDDRARLFFKGQTVPFALSTSRHFILTWASSARLVQFFFYHVVTSHVEVALNLACDLLVLALLAKDWTTSISHDMRLRLNLNRLRCGALAVDGRSEARVHKAKFA